MVVSDVEEEFVAVADGIAEFDGHAAYSFHRLVIDLAYAEVIRTLKAIGFYSEKDVHASQFGIDTFTAESIAPCILDVAANAPESTEQLGISEHDCEGLTVRLTREVIRAWKRKHPNDSEAYEKFWNPDGVAILESVAMKSGNSLFREMAQAARKALGLADEDSASSEREVETHHDADLLRHRKRKAYGRDHHWLDWREKDHLTPAKIRDKWDNLSDERRKQICPGASRKVGYPDPRAGYEVVRAGLRKANMERKLELELKAARE